MPNETDAPLPSGHEGVYFVRPGDVVIFYDKRFPADPGTGENGVPAVNRVAIVVDERGALFLGKGTFGRRRVERLPLQAIPRAPNVQMRRPAHGNTEEVAQFFARHARRPTHFEAGLRALLAGNLQPLIAGFFPHRPTYQTDEEYEVAWRRLVANLKPMDAILTLDLQSPLSRFIAWATDGAWSHVALHVGAGEIWESVTSGIRNGPIDLYKGRRYRVAAYRHCEADKNRLTIEEARAAVGDHRFRPDAYNYLGALRFGWKAFRGDHSHALTPNSSILQGHWILIAQV